VPFEDVMTNPNQVSRADLDVGRLLVGLARSDLARVAQLDPEVVRNATVEHKHRRASLIVKQELIRVLEQRGIIFDTPGFVRHEDGRLGPTRAAVGKMRGRRIQRARRALGMGLVDLACESGVGVGTIQRLEKSGELRPTTSVYAVIGALQLAGYRFARNHGDRRIGERKRPLRPYEKDLPIEWLGVGLHVNIREWIDD
jgi:ribosome-binding protein aMBF1 (putative translation factor)